MRWKGWLRALAAALALGANAPAQPHADTAELAVRGRILVDGQPFDGPGLFRFALVDAAGRTLWSTGPDATLPVAVTQGLYAVQLGGDAPPLRARWLDGPSPARLQAWFDDGRHGPHALGAHAGIARDGKASAAAADDDDAQVVAELRALRAELTALRREVGALRQGHAHAPAAADGARAEVPWRERPTLGNAEAGIVLVEFTDYQCPFCKRFHDQTFPTLRERYLDTGRIAFVSRNLPLPMHRQAGPAALGALCAGEQHADAYWPLRGDLFDNMQQLTPETIRELALARGVDGAAYDACVAADRHATAIAEDKADAAAAGVTGTPSYILGRREGNIVRGEKIVGAKAPAFFEARIRALLDGAAAEEQP